MSNHRLRNNGKLDLVQGRFNGCLTVSSWSAIMKHRHAKRARFIFFGDRSIRRTVHSNDLVKFWVAMYSKKETGNL